MSMKYFNLKNNQQIPALGLGTWQLKGMDCEQAVADALEIGYRYIDTAEAYDNQKQIGKTLSQSNIHRDDLFITSKVFHDHLKKHDVLDSCSRTLEELRLDYLDLYLIHWPNRHISLAETIEAFLQLRNEKKIKMFGVSNFTINHLQDLLDITDEVVNNQVEFHPSLHQKELKQYCDEQKIVITAYSPIAQGKDLQISLVQELADKYERSSSQVVLNWLIGKGINVIPRSADKVHLADNFRTLDWELSPDDIERIDNVGGNLRIVKPWFNEFDY